MTFDEIYLKHNKMVYNLALQYVQNVEDAEEITQDVFVKIQDGLHNFNNQSHIKTWIYRICINQSLDFIKARNSKKRGFFNHLFRVDHQNSYYEPVNFNHPGIELEQKEACDIIFKAINQLSDNQKTALILLKIENKSQAEVAEIMNLNTKALESLFQRAKKNLKVLLNQTEK